jgi:ABC-type lipoprotein release transport system permease subunit
MHVVVEGTGRLADERARALAAAIRAVDPTLIVPAARPMTEFISARANRWRLGAWLLGVFATLALVLAAVGLMTTVGWWVRQRSAEIGVRLALGATPGQMRRFVLRRGLAMIVAGIVLGLASAAAVTRFLEGWIYGIEPLDAATFAVCAAVMLAVAWAAILIPTRRASRIDPIQTLRAD